MNSVEVRKCQCGDSVCTTYSTSNGMFYNGNGYSFKDAEIACEAFNIHNQNGLTPNEILNQRNELLEALKYSESILKELSTQGGWLKEKHNLVNVAIERAQSAIKKATA